MIAAGRLSRPAKFESVRRNRELTKERKKKIAAEDRAARAITGIREARLNSVFIAPKQIASVPQDEDSKNSRQERVLHSPRRCYICKEEFTQLHFFYDSMCPKCAAFNYAKRFQTAPLDGRTALITGARLKIGYYSALMMLRAGARVVVTTRFPADAAVRFSKEEDFSKWGSRLEVYGLDLRHTPSVELFCRFMENHLERLDILINNAAQTVRRPPGLYAHLMENENLPFQKHSEAVR
ncbi:MAG: SDR family oxidoreductase, partial [Spirochaetia bacterium]|nr:SDR family oxidoreductase [Spirochaetia bacterium]